jgi:hypothetical protein
VPIAAKRSDRVSGFEIALSLFAVGALIGAVVLVLAPLQFFYLLGAIIVTSGIAGAWLSAIGLRLEHPERWQALKTSMRVRAGNLPSAS